MFERAHAGDGEGAELRADADLAEPPRRCFPCFQRLDTGSWYLRSFVKYGCDVSHPHPDPSASSPEPPGKIRIPRLLRVKV